MTTPEESLEDLQTLLQTRQSEAETKVLLRAALDVLGFGRDADGQLKGVLGVQAKHDLRIGKLEDALNGLARVQAMVFVAALAVTMWIGQCFLDRYAPGLTGGSRAEAQATSQR